MRIRARSLATLALSASAITCADPSTVPLTGAVTFDPDFSAAAAPIAQRMAEFGITIDEARFILVRGSADTVLDSSVDVDLTTALAVRAFPVAQDAADETYAATVVLTGPAGEIYRGGALANSQTTRVITVDYVGPGANVASITVSPATPGLNGVASTPVTVTALTASGVTVTSPVKWTTSDATVATVSADGVVQSTGKRGSSTIGAETPTFVTGSAVVTVMPNPTQITLESGASQSARYGTALPVLTVVRAQAADGLGVAGVAVTFAAPNGGSVSPASGVTDANGLASTTITLGNIAGPQTFTAAAATLGVIIPEIALAGPAATITTMLGDAQSATILTALPTLLTVTVADAAGNAVPDAMVSWSRVGAGLVRDATSSTNAAGLATNLYTLGSTAGSETIIASTTGAVTPAKFTATATPGGAAALALTVPPLGTAGAALSAVSVTVRDAGGNTVLAAVAITLAKTGGPSGSILAGTVTRMSVGGVATFDDLRFDKAGTTYSLTATSPGLTPAVSTAISIVNPPIAGLSLTGTPSNATNNEPFASAPTVQLLDASSNPIAEAGVVVTMSAVPASGSSATPPALLAGTATIITATTNADGIATFAGIRPVGLAQNFALSFATADGRTVTSSGIPLGVGAPMKVGIVSGSNQVGLIGATLPTAVRAQVLDTLGQATTGAATVSFAASGGGSASPPVAASGGLADATWTLGTTEGGQTLTASVVGSTFGAATFSATASDIHAMTIIQAPSASITNGVAITAQPSLQLRASDGVTNLPKAGVTVTATATMTNGSPTSQALSGATAVSDANGLVTFTNLSVLGSVGDILLHFDVTGGTTQTIPAQSAGVTVVAGSPTVASLGSARVVLKDVPALAAGLRPTVQFRDVSGNAAANASAVSATFSVTAGSCSIPGGSATVTVDALGQAKLPEASLTISSANAFSCRVHATTSPALSGTFDFDIVVPNVSGRAWLGETSREFALASNWSGAVAPTSSDAIFVPSSTPNSPQMQAGASVASLAMESGSTLDIASGNTLTVAGTVDATTVSNGALVATGTSSTIRGIFTAVALSFGDGTNPCSYTLNGAVTATTGVPATSGNVTLVSCVVDVSGQTLTVGRDLSVGGTNGTVMMQNSAGKVTVAGAATFNGASTSTALTAGSLEIAGNFQQSATVSTSSFAPSAAHTTKLTGVGAQSVNFASPATSHFHKLNVTNPSTSGVTITSIVEVANDLTIGASAKVSGTPSGGGMRLTVAGAVSAANTSDLGGLDTLQITGPTFPAYANTTAGKAPDMTVLTNSGIAMTGNVTVAGGLGVTGTLNIAGRTLTIKDSLIVLGTLNMPASMNNVVIVGGLARFKGASTAGHIVEGTLRIAGDFIEDGIATSFAAPSTNFLVQLNGSGSQNVSFTHPGASNSRFGNLDISNTSANGVTFSTDVDVTGTLEQKGRLAIGSGTTTTVIAQSSFRTLGGAFLGAKTVIAGTLQLAAADFYNDSQTTGSGTLTVSGLCRYGTVFGTGVLFVGTSFSVLNCNHSGLP